MPSADEAADCCRVCAAGVHSAEITDESQLPSTVSAQP